MKKSIEYLVDFKTGETYTMTRVKDIIDTKMPDSALKTKLLYDLNRCETTLMRILGNFKTEQANDSDTYTLHIGPDGYGALDTLSFNFCFMFNDRRDFNGGVIFHGVSRIFNDNMTLRENVDLNNENLASISIHT